MTENDTTTTGSRAMFSRYRAVLRRQWWVTGLVTLLAVAVAAGWTATRPDVYAASMKIVVGQGRALFGPDVSFAVQPFTQTMTDLLESDVVARRAIVRQRLRLTPGELLARVRVTSRPDTSVLQVTYEDSDPVRAARTLGTIGEVFTALVDDQLARATPSAPDTQSTRTEPVSATVFDPAHALPGRVSPKPKQTVAIAIVLGLIGGVTLAFLRDALSSRIRNEEEAEAAFGAPVVGLLPPGAVGTTPSQLGALPSKLGVRVAESLQLLAATIRFSDGKAAEKGVVLVTSSRPEDGKTTVVSQLAATLARTGATVIAVEADLRRPALHRFLDIAPDQLGLTDVLSGHATWEQVLIPTRVEKLAPAGVNLSAAYGALATDGPGDGAGELLLLAAGTRRTNPTHVLTLGRSAEMIRELRGLADYVVVDTPPVLVSGDAFPLVQLADTALVVCREGVTSREDARSIQQTLRGLNVRRFSVVVTEAGSVQRKAYGYGYGDD